MPGDLSETIKQLVQAIRKVIDNGVMREELLPENEPWFKWKVDKYQYSDKGVTEFSSHAEEISKPSWLRASIIVERTVEDSKEYSFALDRLHKTFGTSEKIQRGLRSLVWRVIHHFFENQRSDSVQTDLIVGNFIKELRGEPLRYGAHVEIQGVALKTKLLEADFGVTLRQPTIEDLEKEVQAYSPLGRTDFGPTASAILSLEFSARSGREIQERVEKATTVLGLFKVGSVRWESYRMFSDSITDTMAMGTLTAGRSGTALETYLITEDDREKLRTFWQLMGNAIPPSFYEMGPTSTDYLTIAYRRYRDALLQNGILERRIASSMMGLEALFLKRGETQELVYRLSTRISKLLGMLGYNQREVKKALADSYKVRNVFVHGSQLSYQERKKLESKYKDVKIILLSILEYLRATLIVMIFANREKDEFIDLLDDSLIDRKRENELNSSLSVPRGLVGTLVS